MGLDLAKIVAPLKAVRGIEAVVLGGSRGRGAHTATSDYDIGLYYNDAEFDIAALSAVATRLDDEHRSALCTQRGEWGPWVNGGGWLTIESAPVDLLYRDIQRVSRVIDECRAGQVRIEFQPGHPFGFVSAIYMGELATCQPLWDPRGSVAALKKLCDPYPPGLRQGVLGGIAWQSDFDLRIADKSAGRGDLTYVAGCMFHSVTAMCHVISAINGEYCLNEKGALALAARMPIRPVDFKARVDQAFGMLGQDPRQALALLSDLRAEVMALS